MVTDDTSDSVDLSTELLDTDELLRVKSGLTATAANQLTRQTVYNQPVRAGAHQECNVPVTR